MNLLPSCYQAPILFKSVALARSHSFRRQSTWSRFFNRVHLPRPLQFQPNTAQIEAADAHHNNLDTAPNHPVEPAAPGSAQVEQQEQDSTPPAESGAELHTRNDSPAGPSTVEDTVEDDPKGSGAAKKKRRRRKKRPLDPNREALETAAKSLASVQKSKDRKIHELQQLLSNENNPATAHSTDTTETPPTATTETSSTATTETPPAATTGTSSNHRTPAGKDEQLREIRELQQRLFRLEESITVDPAIEAGGYSLLHGLLLRRTAVPPLDQISDEKDGQLRFLRYWRQVVANPTSVVARHDALAIHYVASTDPDTLCIYTDGTARGDSIAAAAVVLSECNIRVKILTENPAKIKLPSLNFNKNEGYFAGLAETEAVLLALRSAEVVAKPGQTVLVCTDSSNHLDLNTYSAKVFKGLVRSRVPNMVEILKKLQERDIKVEICWVPRDSGVPGNCAAHLACRDAALTLTRGEEKVYSDNLNLEKAAEPKSTDAPPATEHNELHENDAT